jgi:hypothetical protein
MATGKDLPERNGAKPGGGERSFRHKSIYLPSADFNGDYLSNVISCPSETGGAICLIYETNLYYFIDLLGRMVLYLPGTDRLAHSDV